MGRGEPFLGDTPVVGPSESEKLREMTKDWVGSADDDDDDDDSPYDQPSTRD